MQVMKYEVVFLSVKKKMVAKRGTTKGFDLKKKMVLPAQR
jgi:hypothetical protein